MLNCINNARFYTVEQFDSQLYYWHGLERREFCWKEAERTCITIKQTEIAIEIYLKGPIYYLRNDHKILSNFY